MADKPPLPPLKPLSAQEWESLIEDFQFGGARREKWTTAYAIVPSLLDQALSCLLRRDFAPKLSIILFLEEFADSLFGGDGGGGGDESSSREGSLFCLIDTLRSFLQTPVDGVAVGISLKEQMMVCVTSILISLEAGADRVPVRLLEGLVELLLTVVNRPNHGPDRQIRVVGCECLRELEQAYPCLLSEIAGHLWSLCQNERTHACQSYILLFTSVVHNIVAQKLSVSILGNSVPLVPFSVPQVLMSGFGSGKGDNAGLNYKELRRALAFLLEWPQVLTPCAMMEFLGMIMPLAVALDLQASMLKVQFFGMIYSFDPVLCHVVLMMYSHFLDSFDGQEGEIARRLLLVSRETQHPLVFRLLALHWLLGFSEVQLRKDTRKINSFVDMGSNFYPSVFDPLALKAMKLDMLAFCSVCLDIMNSESGLVGDGSTGKSMVKLFQDGLVSVSAFKWLPAESTETAVAFRTFHRFLVGGSSHADVDPSTTRTLMESTIFRTVQGMLVDVMLECLRLVPVIVALTDRLLSCQKHLWLGERLLQTFDEHLLSKVKVDYKLVAFFPLFDRIAENDTIPPRRLLELLTKFMVFLVEKHGPETGLKSWSQGSKVLGICRTLLMHHKSSRLFLGLSRLLAFACLYFPDLEVRDNARIYLRMLICAPGKKLRNMLNLGEHLLGISPSPPSSFFNVHSPRSSHNVKTPRNISSYVHLERLIPLLVKQSWSLSLSPLSMGSNKPSYIEDIRDTEPIVEEVETNGSSSIQIIPETERIDQPPEPLRVMDSKISEILGKLRRHFSSIPDFRHMAGLKVRISCSLRFESEPFNRICGVDSPAGGLDAIDTLPAMYATVLKFSSSAAYGFIPSYHIPFLLGEPPTNAKVSGQEVSLDIVPLENGSREDKRFRAPVTIELEPQEPTPGLVDISIETNAENGQIVHGQLHSITVGIEDMFLKAIVPPDVGEDAIPGYYSDLFNALWEACGASCNTGRETFPLKGGKGVAAISGTRSVKLLEIPAPSLVQSVERYLAPFVVSVIGEPLVTLVKDGGIIRDIIWEDVASPDDIDLVADFERGPLHLTYFDAAGEREGIVNISKRNLGSFLVLIFLPPRFHLLFQMEVSDFSTLVRIRTDHWPCLAYIDDYLEALFLA
ncbi:AP-5 complex subunit beta-like protein [Trema orientale]|uniref:AP-5 complex subunit beta-like protein n=1 Tax=Trema orientale TaxID=63057 RepID=A0A2P5D3Y1_TREOI|nr:AP-5 complex subunit beta-like protein [Trema orientale]